MQLVAMSPRRLMAWLFGVAAIELALCLGYAAYAMSNGLALRAAPAPWLNIDGEAALNAWVTSGLLSIAALLMLWAFAAERDARRPTAPGWLLLSLGFFYLSLDEATSIHEQLRVLTTSLSAVWPIFTHRWVMVAVPLVLAAAIVFLPFLIRLPKRTARRLLLAGSVYVAGALGMEMINGAVMAAQGSTAFSYLVLICVEEVLEVLGVLLAIRATALHLATELNSPALRLATA